MSVRLLPLLILAACAEVAEPNPVDPGTDPATEPPPLTCEDLDENGVCDTQETTPASCASLEFGGLDERVLVPDHPTLVFGSDLTVEAWIRSSDLGGRQRVVEKWGDVEQDPDDELALHLWDGELKFVVRGVSGTTLSAGASTSELSEDQWHHVAGTISGGTMRIHVDGVVVAEAFGTAEPIQDTTMDVAIGGNGLFSDDYPFQGRIAGVRLSHIARYGADAFTPAVAWPDDDETAGLWQLDEGDGDVAYDSGFGGHDGDIQGATWVDDCP